MSAPPPSHPLALERLTAPLALVAVALIWGSSHLVVKLTLAGLSVPLLLALRFSVAALLLVRVPTRAAWRSGLVLGVLSFAMYAAHNHGMTDTSPARAAFIMGSSALLVPLLGWWAGERPALSAVLAAILGVFGLGVMLLTGPLHASVGDAWVRLAAVLFAVYVRRLGRASPEHPGLSLVFPQLCVMAALAWVWALPRVGELARLSPGALWGALYLGVFANLVVMALQGFALRVMAPGRAALWLLLEPVFAVVLTGLATRSAPTSGLLLGGGLVLLALGLGGRAGVVRRCPRTVLRPVVGRLGVRES